MVECVDKLNLILEHALEYYDNGRHYEFFEDGFISYEIFKDDQGIQSVYFADIFITKKARHGSTLRKITDFCESLEGSHGVKVAYCKVEIKNVHIKAIQAMYERIGFKEYHRNISDIYYMCDRR